MVLCELPDANAHTLHQLFNDIGLTVLIATLSVAVVRDSLRVRISVDEGVPGPLADGWRAAAEASLRWVTLEWSISSECDLKLSLAGAQSPVPLGFDPRPGANLGEWRPEFERSAGVWALAGTPRVWLDPLGYWAKQRKQPEKWAEHERARDAGAALEQRWAAEVQGKVQYFMPLDERRMVYVLLTRCQPDVELSSASRRAARWWFGVHSQNVVIQGGFYSPWSKMVNPPGARRWEEISPIPSR